MYYNDLNNELKTKYGCKVYKLALSSGCSCPNRDGTIGSNGCIFCDGAGAFAESGDITSQLEAAKSRVHLKAGKSAKYIAYFQSFTNTYAPADKLQPMFMQAIAADDIVALSVATRPDCLPNDIMELLAELNAIKPVWVELGLQTIHKKSAEYIRRGYDLPVYDEAVAKLKRIGITVVVHQILGLPGETADMMVETSRYIGASGADGIKLHLLHVLEGTDLAAHWREGRFKTMELDEYINVLERCLQVLPKETVIHRLTGDGAKKDLLAPLWSADKKRVLNAISAAFRQDDIVQGSCATHCPS